MGLQRYIATHLRVSDCFNMIKHFLFVIPILSLAACNRGPRYDEANIYNRDIINTSTRFLTQKIGVSYDEVEKNYGIILFRFSDQKCVLFEPKYAANGARPVVCFYEKGGSVSRYYFNEGG